MDFQRVSSLNGIPQGSAIPTASLLAQKCPMPGNLQCLATITMSTISVTLSTPPPHLFSLQGYHTQNAIDVSVLISKNTKMTRGQNALSCSSPQLCLGSSTGDLTLSRHKHSYYGFQLPYQGLSLVQHGGNTETEAREQKPYITVSEWA